MPVPVYFSRVADAWLDEHTSSAQDVYIWALDAAMGRAEPGRILPGYQPEARVVRIQGQIDVSYVRRMTGITVIMLRESAKGAT